MGSREEELFLRVENALNELAQVLKPRCTCLGEVLTEDYGCPQHGKWLLLAGKNRNRKRRGK